MIAPKTSINRIVSSAAGHTAILIKGKLRGLRVLVISAGAVVARVPAPPGPALPRLTPPGLVFAGLVLPVILAFTFSLAGCYWTEESPEGGISLRIAVPENRFSSREEQPYGTDAGVLTATVVDDGMLRSDREIALRFFADLEAETDRSAALLEEMEGGDGIDAASRGSTPMRLDLPYPATQFQGVAVSYGPDTATTGTTTFSGLNGGSRYLIVVRIRTDETTLAGYAVVGVRAGESRTIRLEPAHNPDDPDSAFSRFLSDRYGLEPETADPEGPMYSIGDPGPAGGWIFYIDQTNVFEWTYLEAAPVDWADPGNPEPADPTSVWSNVNNAEVGTLTIIGSGLDNSQAIINQEDHIESAAAASVGLSYGGYTDWFLPSKSELDLMYQNLKNSDIGDFSGNYWSSSEDGHNNAWNQNFNSGFQPTSSKTIGTVRTRPIRAF